MNRFSILLKHPFALIWVVLAYIPLLWKAGIPFTGDQKTYISVAMEMREKGEWLRPMLFGESNYLKPPFQYWMTLISWNLFGFNVWATFLPSVIALILTAYLLSEISLLLGERRWTVSSGLWFACSLGAMSYGLSAQMDIYLCLFWSLGWWSAFRFLIHGRNTKWLVLSFLTAGICAWIKSPLYSVLWVVGFFMYLFISGEWLLFRERRLYASLFVGILVGLSWYVFIAFSDGTELWKQYFLQEQFNKGDNGGTIRSLWLPLLYLTFPFTFMILVAVRAMGFRWRTSAVYKFVLSWCIPPALFFTFFPYKTSLYLFILIPALAVFVDWGCFRASRTRTYRFFSRLTGVTMGVAMVLSAFYLFSSNSVPLWGSIGFLLVGGLAIYTALKTEMKGFLVAAFFSIFLLRLGASWVLQDDYNNLKTAVSHAETTHIAMLDEKRDIWHEIGLVAVNLQKPMTRLYGFDDMKDFLYKGGAVILSDEQYEAFFQTLENEFKSTKFKIVNDPWKHLKRTGAVSWTAWLWSGNPLRTLLEDHWVRVFQVIYLRPVD